MNEHPKNVRLATPADAEKLVEFVRAGHKESAIFTLSETKIRRIIADATNGTRDHLVIIGVIDTPDKSAIAASLALEYAQVYYSDDWFLSELWNNVHADYRKSHYGQDLIKFGKWVSDNSQRTLAMSIITTARLETKIALYRRKMQQVGGIFMYNLGLSQGPAAGEVH